MLENEVHVGELDHQRNRLMWDTTHHSITTWRGSAPITDSHLENSTPPYHLLQYDWVNSLIFFLFSFSFGGKLWGALDLRSARQVSQVSDWLL